MNIGDSSLLSLILNKDNSRLTPELLKLQTELESSVTDYIRILDSNSDKPLDDIQVDLESLQNSKGIQKTLDRLRDTKIEHSTTGSRLISTVVPKVAAKVDLWKKSKGKTAGAYGSAYPLLSQIHTHAIAFIAVRNVVKTIVDHDVSITKLARTIGQELRDHYEWSQLRENYTALADSMVKKADQLQLSTSARIQMMKRVKKDRVITDEWKNSDYIAAGSKCLDLVSESCELFTIKTVRKGHKTYKFVVAHPSILSYIQSTEIQRALNSFDLLPMVVPPLDWTTPHDGGYLQRRMPLVKSPVGFAKFDSYDQFDLTKVYQAINAVQSTGWRINTKVFHVLKDMWNSGTQQGELPCRDDFPIPEKPKEFKDKQERAKYQRDTLRVIEANQKLASLRQSLVAQLSIAEKFLNQEAIYFPHQLDFRGRMYPVTSYLHPQGDGISGGLLEFAEGKPLTGNGAYWLAVQLANVYDECDGVKLGQLSLDERVQWVHDHEVEILNSTINPQEFTWWAKGEKPWKVLAACYEWVGYMFNGENHVCHLPIQVDGSCNGLQHFAALLRDTRGAQTVNLLPSDKPQDIYSVVADRVSELVREDAEQADETALWWKGRVNRKIVKRPVMTLPYGVTRYGMVEQTVDELKEQHGSLFEAQPYAKYIVDKIYEALESTIQSSLVAMSWLQDCCQIVSDENKPMLWVTPSGFPVSQEYWKKVMSRMRVHVAGKDIRVCNYLPSFEQVNGKKARSSVAPNFVHSMDAAHLTLSVCACVNEGIESFSMIHDSFGTHASDVDVFNVKLREEFVKMYASYDLSDFLEHLGDYSFPKLPDQGSLVLDSVMKSDYFFS